MRLVDRQIEGNADELLIHIWLPYSGRNVRDGSNGGAAVGVGVFSIPPACFGVN